MATSRPPDIMCGTVTSYRRIERIAPSRAEKLGMSADFGHLSRIYVQTKAQGMRPKSPINVAIHQNRNFYIFFQKST